MDVFQEMVAVEEACGMSPKASRLECDGCDVLDGDRKYVVFGYIKQTDEDFVVHETWPDNEDINSNTGNGHDTPPKKQSPVPLMNAQDKQTGEEEDNFVHVHGSGWDHDRVIDVLARRLSPSLEEDKSKSTKKRMGGDKDLVSLRDRLSSVDALYDEILGISNNNHIKNNSHAERMSSTRWSDMTAKLCAISPPRYGGSLQNTKTL